MPTTEGGARALTSGERAITGSVFGAALDDRAVTLRRRKYWWLQPAWTVMAPDGHIWFHPHNRAWREDFAAAGLSLRAFLVHELVHVWQHQQGRRLLRERPWIARYDYALEPGKPFAAYGIEQQAEIVAHAYMLREGGPRADLPPLAAYAALLPFGDWTRPPALS